MKSFAEIILFCFKRWTIFQILFFEFLIQILKILDLLICKFTKFYIYKIWTLKFVYFKVSALVLSYSY